MLRVRVLLLLFLTAFATRLWVTQSPYVWLPWPVDCDGERPAWLGEWVQEAKVQGLPGFQLSLSDVTGKRTHCVAGWARLWPWPQALRQDHVMRYASLSKLMTSAYILRLFERGELRPDNLLVDALAITSKPADRRIEQITIANLLSHTAGFDRALSSDPMMSRQPWCPADISTLSSVRLDHEPGEVYAYSNLGYCLLGAVIERYDGMPLKQVFQNELLTPLRIEGKVLQQGEILLNEPTALYNEHESEGEMLQMNFSAMHATGAWAGNSREFLALLNGIAGPSATLLSEAGQRELLSVASSCDISQWRNCHGYAFYKYAKQGKKAMFWRDGSLPNATSFAAIMEDGQSVVFLTHARQYDWKTLNDRLGLILYDYLVRQ